MAEFLKFCQKTMVFLFVWNVIQCANVIVFLLFVKCDTSIQFKHVFVQVQFSVIQNAKIPYNIGQKQEVFAIVGSAKPKNREKAILN